MRLFRELGPAGAGGPEVEGFLGLYLICPTAGAGLRWHYVPLRRETNALALRPGVDGYVLVNPFYRGDGLLGGGNPLLGLVAADVDCVWQRRYGARGVGEAGIKLGGGLGFSAKAALLPVGGVFLGLRY